MERLNHLICSLSLTAGSHLEQTRFRKKVHFEIIHKNTAMYFIKLDEKHLEITGTDAGEVVFHHQAGFEYERSI